MTDPEFPVAIMLFEEVLQTQPHDPRCAYRLLCCHAQVKGQSPQALQWFARSIEWGLATELELDPANDAALQGMVGLPEFRSLRRTLEAQRHAAVDRASDAHSSSNNGASVRSASSRSNRGSSSSKPSKHSKRRPSRHSTRRGSASSATSFAPPRSYQMLHILLKHQGSARQASWRDPDGALIMQRTQAAAEQSLNNLLDELYTVPGDQRAEHFAGLAGKVSDCGSAREGGNLGVLCVGDMDEDFEEAALGLPVWGLSGVIGTESGSHIVMRTPVDETSAEEAASSTTLDDEQVQSDEPLEPELELELEPEPEPVQVGSDRSRRASSASAGSGSSRRSRGRDPQSAPPTGFSWAKLKQLKFSVLMELLRKREPPQDVVNWVLDARDPKSAAVRALQRFDRHGNWSDADAMSNSGDSVSSSGKSAASAHSSRRGSGASVKSGGSSHTTTASAQTETASDPTESSESESESESGGSSSESGDGVVHPLIQEAADKMWLKMKLEGGQRSRTPAQMFAAAREMLAMPDRPPQMQLEEEALMLCPIMSIEVEGLQKLVRRFAKAREVKVHMRIQQREKRRVDKAHSKALRDLRDDIDEAIGCGDLDKVIDLQGRVAQVEYDGYNIDSLGGGMEQLAHYALVLSDNQAAADAVVAKEKEEESDAAKALLGEIEEAEEDEDDPLIVDMKGWYEVAPCEEALARLHQELIYLRPASTSPKMELVLSFDEMFANKERLFVKTMTTSLHQQALHATNVEKSSRGTKLERGELNMGYVVPVGKREFFFSCLTESEVLQLFDAVRQTYRAEWRARAVVAQKDRSQQRRPKDQEMARELPAYQQALAALLACDEFPQEPEFQTNFKMSVEKALGSEHVGPYTAFEASSSEQVQVLLRETREAFQEGWRRVYATKHPQCASAIKALAHFPAVPVTFRRTVERELSHALVSADAEHFEQLLLGSSSTCLPAVRKLLSDAMLAFDDEKSRLDRLAAEEKTKSEERAVASKIVQDAWMKAKVTGPEKREEETEDAKESRRIAKARLRGRRQNMDQASLAALSGTAEIVAIDAAAREAWGRVQSNGEGPEEEQDETERGGTELPYSPTRSPDKCVTRDSMTAEQAFHATLAGEDKLGSLLGMHLRRAFQEKESEAVVAAEPEPEHDVNRVSEFGSEISDPSGPPKPRRRPRPLSAGLRATVEGRTGRKIHAISGTVDTASIAEFARRRAKERDDATNAVKRLTEELSDARRQKEQQMEAIENLQTRVESLNSKQHITMPARSSAQHDLSETSHTAVSTRIDVRTLIATPTLEPNQLTTSAQVRASEQAAVAGATGDWRTVHSILNEVPQSATVISSSSATLMHRLLAAPGGITLHLYKKLVALHPGAVKLADIDGKLPLHVALSNRDTSQEVALSVLGSWMEAAGVVDGTGQVALHKALTASLPVDVMLAILDAAPVAASLQDRLGRLPLHLGVMFGAPSSVLRSLLRINRGGLLVQDANHDTPLHSLFRAGAIPSADAVGVLCGSSMSSAALRVADSAGDTPLHLAVRRRAGEDICTVLLETEPLSCSALNWKGEAPIHEAVRVACTTVRTQRRASAQDSGQRSKPADTTLRLLLKLCPESASVLHADGSSALHVALEHGGRELGMAPLIEELVAVCPKSVGTKCTPTGETALMVALRHSALPRIVRTLAVASPQSAIEPDAEGCMPATVCVQLAAKLPDKAASVHQATTQAAARLRALVESCPDALRTGDTRTGTTPLLAACGCETGAPLLIMSVLFELDSGSESGESAVALDVTTPSCGGDTALHLLVKAPSPKQSAIKMVLEASHAAARAQNAAGATPLHLALMNGNICEEVATLLLARCPAAAAIPSVSGDYPLHCALANPETPADLFNALLDAFPGAVDKPNALGHSALALGLQAQPDFARLSSLPAEGKGLAGSIGRALVAVAFDRVLTASIVDEDRQAAAEHRGQSRAILKHWHMDRLYSAVSNGMTSQLPVAGDSVDVEAWQITDVQAWIRFVALVPPIDALSPAEVRFIAAGKWPPCAAATDMAEAFINGAQLLQVRVINDLPTTVRSNMQAAEALLRAIKELWGLQRTRKAKAAFTHDAAAMALEAAEETPDEIMPVAAQRSVVYESLLDAGIALVLEFKEQRAKPRTPPEEVNSRQPELEPVVTIIPKRQSVFDLLSNEELFTGTQRFRKRRDANIKAGKCADSAVDDDAKLDRASVRTRWDRVRQVAEKAFTEELDAAWAQFRERSEPFAPEASSDGICEALLERAIVLFLRCRKLDATDLLPPYNLACCHALLASPDIHGASYWATIAFELGMSAIDFAADEDLVPVRGVPSFDRIIVAAAAEQGAHTGSELFLRTQHDTTAEIDSFAEAALNTERGADEQARELRKLGLLFPVAAVTDRAVSYVEVAAVRIQALFRGFAVRVKTRRLAALKVAGDARAERLQRMEEQQAAAAAAEAAEQQHFADTEAAAAEEVVRVLEEEATVAAAAAAAVEAEAEAARAAEAAAAAAEATRWRKLKRAEATTDAQAATNGRTPDPRFDRAKAVVESLHQLDAHSVERDERSERDSLYATHTSPESTHQSEVNSSDPEDRHEQRIAHAPFSIDRSDGTHAKVHAGDTVVITRGSLDPDAGRWWTGHVLLRRDSTHGEFMSDSLLRRGEEESKGMEEREDEQSLQPEPEPEDEEDVFAGKGARILGW